MRSLPRFTAVAGCFAMGVAMGVIPWLFRHRFYFHDDMQHQHMPIFVHIGRLLRAGEWPILSLASFTSGNLLGEYQFAVLNPVSLAVYAVLPSFSSLATAALFLACFYYGVLSAGTYVLARSYGAATPAAVLAALVMASNNLLTYWFAASWFPVFVSIAWFTLAWAYLVRAQNSRLDWLLAVLFCYLTITSGWPQTTIMLGVVCVLLAIQAWRASGLRLAAAPVLALGAATLLAATTLLGLSAVTEVAARYSGLANGNVFVPNLRDLLAMSAPFHRGFMSWGGYRLVGTPMFFLAWFVVPLLPFLRWGSNEWRRPEMITLAVVAGLCLFLTQGPEEFYMVRWPFRWTPYFHIATLLLFLAIASRAGFAPVTRWRVITAVLLLAVSGLSSMQADPLGLTTHLAGLGICAVALATFLVTRAQTTRFVLVGAVSLLLFVGTHALFTMNTDVPDWGLSEDVEPGLAANVAPGAYSLYLGWLGHPADTERLREFQTGMMPRVQEAALVNGYTPIGHRSGSELLCMNMFGETCPEVGPRLFERDPETGQRYVDLLRIDRLIVMKGPHLDRLRPFLNPAWRLEFDGRVTQRYVRNLPNRSLPGTVSWVSGDAKLAAAGATHPTREQFQLARSGGEPTTIVFARLWWPGYRAEFGGERLSVTAHDGIFVTVVVPAGAGTGVLTLRYLPPFLGLGIAGIIAGLALVIGYLIFGSPVVAAARASLPGLRRRSGADAEAAAST